MSGSLIGANHLSNSNTVVWRTAQGEASHEAEEKVHTTTDRSRTCWFFSDTWRHNLFCKSKWCILCQLTNIYMLPHCNKKKHGGQITKNTKEGFEKCLRYQWWLCDFSEWNFALKTFCFLNMFKIQAKSQQDPATHAMKMRTPSNKTFWKAKPSSHSPVRSWL